MLLSFAKAAYPVLVKWHASCALVTCPVERTVTKDFSATLSDANACCSAERRTHAGFSHEWRGVVLMRETFWATRAASAGVLRRARSKEVSRATLPFCATPLCPQRFSAADGLVTSNVRCSFVESICEIRSGTIRKGGCCRVSAPRRACYSRTCGNPCVRQPRWMTVSLQDFCAACRFVSDAVRMLLKHGCGRMHAVDAGLSKDNRPATRNCV